MGVAGPTFEWKVKERQTLRGSLRGSCRANNANELGEGAQTDTASERGSKRAVNWKDPDRKEKIKDERGLEWSGVERTRDAAGITGAVTARTMYADQPLECDAAGASRPLQAAPGPTSHFSSRLSPRLSSGPGILLAIRSIVENTFRVSGSKGFGA